MPRYIIATEFVNLTNFKMEWQRILGHLGSRKLSRILRSANLECIKLMALGEFLG
jgi:hypothetical protein